MGKNVAFRAAPPVVLGAVLVLLYALILHPRALIAGACSQDRASAEG
ncbi:MAG: hypothetical protein ABSC13_03945 [Dehalococcoidia bacterium]|jgi:hypothetical protein